MKIIERNENRYVLEPLKHYLENEGIKADIQKEWKIGKMQGPYILTVEDALYNDAIMALDNIDKCETDDGIPLTTESGETAEQIKERQDMVGRWLARLVLFLVLACLLYFSLE